MKGEAGFQERLNWKDVEKENPPQKGFGEIGKKKDRKKEALRKEPTDLADIGGQWKIEKNPDMDNPQDREEKKVLIKFKGGDSKVTVFHFSEIPDISNEKVLKELQSALKGIPQSHLDNIDFIEISNSFLATTTGRKASGFLRDEEPRFILITKRIAPKMLDKNKGDVFQAIKWVSRHEVGHNCFLEKIRGTNIENQVKRVYNYIGEQFKKLPEWIDESEFFADMYVSYLSDKRYFGMVEKNRPPIIPSITNIIENLLRE